MCTCIFTIRSLLWYITTLVSTALLLVALFTNKWLNGRLTLSNLSSTESISGAVSDVANTITGGGSSAANPSLGSVGLFLYCVDVEKFVNQVYKEGGGQEELEISDTLDQANLFEGECLPDVSQLVTIFSELDDGFYPHAWRAALVCFGAGLALMLITLVLGLFTMCFRYCLCVSIHSLSGSLQSLASIFFAIGLVAYCAGWGSEIVRERYCGGESAPFVLGPYCQIGSAFWIAVAASVGAFLSAILAVSAYRSTHSRKFYQKVDQGDTCIFLA